MGVHLLSLTWGAHPKRTPFPSTPNGIALSCVSKFVTVHCVFTVKDESSIANKEMPPLPPATAPMIDLAAEPTNHVLDRSLDRSRDSRDDSLSSEIAEFSEEEDEVVNNKGDYRWNFYSSNLPPMFTNN